jgi:assimilatory nitrate reductase catalytic subunit
MNAPSPAPSAVRTTCPYCGVGCGLKVQAAAGKAHVAGDETHPANYSRLCSKGAALGETVGLDGRLLHPMMTNANGVRQRVDWDTALDAVAGGFKRIVEHGPDAVAFYLSGQLLTEDYYVPNKLMKGFIGSANVDTNSRLCMASSVVGHNRAFGADTVPGVYEDLDSADLIVLVGSNTAWCHPVLFQRMVQNRNERGAKIVVIDPRRTATCEDGDLFLPLAPGSDTVLFSALLGYLADHHALSYDYIEKHTAGFENALARAREIAPNIGAAARACGIAKDDLEKFCEWFRATEKVVTCYSQGVNQSAQGSDKVNVIINCHLATARIGRPGMGPFSLTGQPNAMGGREVGGLANQLAAHMKFNAADIDRVRRFWNAPNMAAHEGLKAVDMFEAIARGEIKALWVMATNPAMSLPKAGAMREALRKLELFVVSENVLSNDTVNSGAHILLPAAAWGEKNGTVTNSERRISRQRPFLPLPGEARPDWWAVAQVAQRMGYEGFAYQSAAEIFREHAALSGFENGGARDFDIGGLATLTDREYDAMSPVQWPVPADHVDLTATKRFFADGNFYTPDRKARFIAPEMPTLREKQSRQFPLRLNTGRVRDQWHSMTRTGRSARLASHIAEPFVEVHPADAAAASLADGGFAKVTTAYGECVMKIMFSEGQRPGSLFVPIHWSDETASSARVGALVTPHADPHSGQPEMKATPAAIAPAELPVRGFLRSRRHIELPQDTWWVRIAIREGSEQRLASARDALFWHEFAQCTLGEDAQLVEFLDAAKGVYRAAAFIDGEFEGAISIGPGDSAIRWDGLKALIAAGAPEHSLPSVTPSLDSESAGDLDASPVVCACLSVTLDTVNGAIRDGAAHSVADLGKLTGAGTSCGSCLPELKRIVAHARSTSAETR